jgi:Rhs element Vgr protein
MERVWEWTVEKRIQPGVIALVDYDYKAPTKNLYADKSAPAGHANAGYQVFDYPGLYIEHADGQSYAAIRNEEQAAQHVAARAIGDSRGLFAGCKFKLQGYPRADQNIEHIVTLASIYASTDEWDTSKSGTGTEACKIAFSTLPAQTQFRPARTTPRPKVAGPQTAIVVGATGEEIHTDPEGFGRVKVHFHWDPPRRRGRELLLLDPRLHGLGGQEVGQLLPAPHGPGGRGRLHRGRPGPAHHHRARPQQRQHAPVQAPGLQDHVHDEEPLQQGWRRVQ